MKAPFHLSIVASAVILGTAIATPAIAEEKQKEDLETITIIGDSSSAKKVAGSAHIVTEAELEAFKYMYS